MRRFISTGIILFYVITCCFLNAVGAETFCAGNAAFYVLFSDEGEVYTAPGIYAPIIRLSDGLFAGADESGWHVLDSAGRSVDGRVYEKLVYEDGCILYREGSLWGIADTNMRRIFDSVYTSLVSTGMGTFAALKTGYNDLTPDTLYILRKNGKEIETGVKVMYGLSRFAHGVSPLTSSEGVMGYITYEGEWLSEPSYNYAGMFSMSGYAPVTANGKTGVIGIGGDIVLPISYESVMLSENGPYALCTDSDGISMWDLDTGENVYEFLQEHAFGTLLDGSSSALISLGTDTYLVSPEGNVLFQAPSSEGLTAVSAFNGGYIVSDDNCSRVIDKDGNLLTGPWKIVKAVAPGCYACLTDDMVFFTDEKGKPLFSRPCLGIAPAGNGYCFLTDEKGTYIIDTTGKEVVSFKASPSSQ